jgi:hypothetical protein
VQTDKPVDTPIEDKDIGRLWEIFAHDDDLLAQRVAFFLVAESILIATAASLINATASLKSTGRVDVRAEMFSLSTVFILAGLGLTAIFWYIFRLNFDNIGASLELLRESSSIYAVLHQKQSERRRSRRYLPRTFNEHGMNWVTVNCLTAGLMVIWILAGIFALLIFLAR